MNAWNHTVVAHVLNKVMQALWPHGVQSGTLLLVTDNGEYIKKLKTFSELPSTDTHHVLSIYGSRGTFEQFVSFIQMKTI